MMTLLRRPKAGMWQGAVLVGAVTFAYALDYLFNLAAGRILSPAEFSIVVALAGIGQVLVVASRVIQTVTTRYVARFQAEAGGAARTTAFFRSMWRAAWRWGLLALGAGLLLSYPVARFLAIPQLGPVLALAAAIFLMVIRPVVGGTLQGVQQFVSLGVVQVAQAALRLLFGVGLMLAGWGALGAVGSLPLASAVALLVSLWLVKRVLTPVPVGTRHEVALPELFRYTGYTAAGLIGYAVLMNMDAILVRRFFDTEAAGNYSAAVTLGKVIQFFPVAVIMVLFPKAAQRRASHRDPGDVLAVAMAVVGVTCGVIAASYALYAGPIVRFTLGSSYEVSNLLLGLLGGAMLLLSLANVWLNYYLSTEWTKFVYLIAVAVILQAVLMWLFHDELWQLPAAMGASGLWLTVAGAVVYWRRRNEQA
jgi:O-antigen/teichoic acid export membrane protein